MIICIYALVSPAPARLTIAGIGGERLRVIAVDRVAAVVGEIRRVPAPTITNLRRYAAIVEAIAVKVPAVLPARFATTVADREELAFILRSRGTALRQRLRAVRGRAKMTIRLVSESESSDALFPSQSRAAGRARVRLGVRIDSRFPFLRDLAVLNSPQLARERLWLARNIFRADRSHPAARY